jgi:predicted SnoaL-like aldol condensation-catalyzing enzyme
MAQKSFSIRDHWSALLRIFVLTGLAIMPSFTPGRSQDTGPAASAKLGEAAQKVLIDIFRKKDVTVIDRYFAEPFVQHDPNIPDGLSGMKGFAAEVAKSPSADITIFRTLVDGERGLIHSRYEGLKNAPTPLIAFDLVRFKDGKIVEHWGGQQPEAAAPNISGHSQVDGPAVVRDRDKTEANLTLVRTYREAVMVQQHYGRIVEFVVDNIVQHASTIGDGIEPLKARFSDVAKPGTSVLIPRLYVADGNFVLSMVEARTDPPTVNFDLFRIASNKIAEHWEVLAPIPARDEWKNSNGPF